VLAYLFETMMSVQLPLAMVWHGQAAPKRESSHRRRRLDRRPGHSACPAWSGIRDIPIREPPAAHRGRLQRRREKECAKRVVCGLDAPPIPRDVGLPSMPRQIFLAAEVYQPSRLRISSGPVGETEHGEADSQLGYRGGWADSRSFRRPLLLIEKWFSWCNTIT
jgi:hypothetical protein